MVLPLPGPCYAIMLAFSRRFGLPVPGSLRLWVLFAPSAMLRLLGMDGSSLFEPRPSSGKPCLSALAPGIPCASNLRLRLIPLPGTCGVLCQKLRQLPYWPASMPAYLAALLSPPAAVGRTCASGTLLPLTCPPSCSGTYLSSLWLTTWKTICDLNGRGPHFSNIYNKHW